MNIGQVHHMSYVLFIIIQGSQYLQRQKLCTTPNRPRLSQNVHIVTSVWPTHYSSVWLNLATNCQHQTSTLLRPHYPVSTTQRHTQTYRHRAWSIHQPLTCTYCFILTKIQNN